MKLRRLARADQELERVIEYLYREGPDRSIDEFRMWALDQARQVLPFDAALWGVGSFEDRRFHSTTTVCLPPEFPGIVERTRSINPAFQVLHDYPGVPVAVSELLGSGFRRSAIYRELYRPWKLEQILATATYDARSGLFALITFYRTDAGQAFSPAERRRVGRLVPHLAGAGSSSYFRRLARLNRVRHADSHVAVCDRFGVLHEAQPGFVDLLARHYPDWEGPALPFKVEDGNVNPDILPKPLTARIRPAGDLFVIEVWSRTLFDDLSSREQQVAQGLLSGQSYKDVARRIGVSPSTVSTYVKRIYAKVGGSGRTALRDLIRRRAR